MKHALSPVPVILALFLLLLALRANVWNGEGIDECYYYAQLASPAFDRDLDFTNDFLESRNAFPLRLQLANRFFQNGIIDVPFPAGTAILNTPLLLLARALDALADNRLGAADRFSYYYRAIPTFSTWLLVLTGLIASHRVAIVYTTRWRAAWLVLLLFLGTNLCYYTWAVPAMAHGCAFGMGALLLLAITRYSRAPSLLRAAELGITLGAAFLLRWQDAAAIIVLLATLIAAPRRPNDWRERLLILAIAAAIALPQLATWRNLYGNWLVIPQGGAFFILDPARIFHVLFSPLNGWLWTHPLLILPVAAFATPGAWKNHIARGCLLYLLAAAFINSLPGDWWAGGSFGNRRFIGILPFLIPAAAISLQNATKPQRHALLAIALILTLANQLLVSRFMHEPPRPVFWGAFLAQLPDHLAALLQSPRYTMTSDLFTVTHPTHARLLFLLLIAAVPLLLLAAARLRRNLALLLPTIILVYTIAWSAMILVTPIPNRHLLARWSGEVTPLLAAGSDADVLAAAGSEDDTSNLDVPRLYTLRHALDQRRFEDAVELSNDLAPRYPRSVLDLWLRYAPDREPLRREWVQQLETRAEHATSTLEILHREASWNGEHARASAISRRIGGQMSRQHFRRFLAAYATAAKAKRLRTLLTRAIAANPFYGEPIIESIRIENNRNAAQPLLARQRRRNAEALELALYVHYHHADLRDIFEPYWRPILTDHLRILEIAAQSNVAAARLREATALGLDHSEVSRWRERITRNLLDQRRRLAPTTTTLARCDPQSLRPEDGWGPIEIDSNTRTSWRWSMSPIVFAALDRPLPPGNYNLHIQGYRIGNGANPPDLRFDLYGQEQQIRVTIPPGSFSQSITLNVPERISLPRIRIYCPTLRVRDFYPNSEDNRKVGILVSHLSVETAPTQ